MNGKRQYPKGKNSIFNYLLTLFSSIPIIQINKNQIETKVKSKRSEVQVRNNEVTASLIIYISLFIQINCSKNLAIEKRKYTV